MRRRTALVGLGAICTSACSKIANTATAGQIFARKLARVGAS